MDGEITKITFDGMDTDSKLSVLFDLSRAQNRQVSKLLNRKRVDKALSVAGGFVGGFAAIVAKGAFWK